MEVSSSTATVLEQVAEERQRQDAKWGQQSHHPAMWFAILTEEVGELATAIITDVYGSAQQRNVKTIYEEAIQVAAVAVALCEYLRRTEAGDA